MNSCGEQGVRCYYAHIRESERRGHFSLHWKKKKKKEKKISLPGFSFRKLPKNAIKTTNQTMFRNILQAWGRGREVNHTNHTEASSPEADMHKF